MGDKGMGGEGRGGEWRGERRGGEKKGGGPGLHQPPPKLTSPDALASSVHLNLGFTLSQTFSIFSTTLTFKTYNVIR
jgi:hypothetical protein